MIAFTPIATTGTIPQSVLGVLGVVRAHLSLEKPKATLDVHAFSTQEQDTKSIHFIMFA